MDSKRKIQSHDGPVYQKLVADYEPLVKRIAYHLMIRLPANILLDDLIQAGMIGLIEAADNFKTDKGASFETYASIRIRGHMLDEVRRGDWIPRSVHRNSRKITEAIRIIENAKGRDAKDFEVAAALEISLDDYQHMLCDMTNSKIFGFEDLTDFDDTYDSLDNMKLGTPYEEVKLSCFYEQLRQCVNKLPEREKEVLILYYTEEMNLKDIGNLLGVSESRISQIHSQAMCRLKSRMRDWKSH